jgi:hypothetical protein
MNTYRLLFDNDLFDPNVVVADIQAHDYAEAQFIATRMANTITPRPQFIDIIDKSVFFEGVSNEQPA